MKQQLAQIGIVADHGYSNASREMTKFFVAPGSCADATEGSGGHATEFVHKSRPGATRRSSEEAVIRR